MFILFLHCNIINIVNRYRKILYKYENSNKLYFRYQLSTTADNEHEENIKEENILVICINTIIIIIFSRQIPIMIVYSQIKLVAHVFVDNTMDNSVFNPRTPRPW